MPGYKKLPNSKPIVNITIDEELLNKVENYQFDNRLKNRSQAFTEIIERGFEQIVNDQEREHAKDYLIKLIQQL